MHTASLYFSLHDDGLPWRKRNMFIPSLGIAIRDQRAGIWLYNPFDCERRIGRAYPRRHSKV